LNKKFLFFIIVVSIQLFGNSLSFSQKNDDKNLSENPTQLRQYVTDETNTLTPSQLSSLNSKLQKEDKATTNQIIVYMISSLNGESLEDVSIRLAEKNKIGKKERNNGLLMLVVKDDRKIRIEVGYGLEGVMTDALSSSIIRNVMTPSFKAGNYYEGIDKGVDAVISAIKGEYTADKNSLGSEQTCCFGIPIFIIIIFGFIFFFIFMSVIRSIFGRGRSVYTGRRGWNNGGWGGFGGGSWGGGGGGGGFSGGGGSFGGGGASGSW
jgi:uncharacterized protein